MLTLLLRTGTAMGRVPVEQLGEPRQDARVPSTVYSATKERGRCCWLQLACNISINLSRGVGAQRGEEASTGDGPTWANIDRSSATVTARGASRGPERSCTFFVFVGHALNAMSGAMQLSRG